jgi:hypothetical protein
VIKNLYFFVLVTALMSFILPGGLLAETAQKTGAGVPSLVTTAEPAPEVIYTKGSRDAILIANDGLIEGNIDGGIETPITQKVRELDNLYQAMTRTTQGYQQRLADLQARSDAAASRYFTVMARINTELQSGTTPGNPILLGLWDDAQNQLDMMSGMASTLNTVASELAAESTKAAFLQDNISATYSLSGAVKQDHVRLRQVEDDVNQGIVTLNRLLTQVSDEIGRRQAILRTEKLNLQTVSLSISNGELYGQNLSNSLYRKASVDGSSAAVQKPAVTTFESASTETFSAPAPVKLTESKPAEAAPPATETMAPVTVQKAVNNNRAQDRTAALSQPQPVPSRDTNTTVVEKKKDFVAGRKPVVIIRFDRPNVNYEQPLYTAMNSVLDRFPAAQFDLVAVSTTKGNPAEQALATSAARKNGESVLRALSQMGLPVERVQLNAASSKNVNNTEVHIYMQ